MLLILRVVGWPEGVTPAPLFAHFDAGGGLIGRSETARLALPDPKRTVSRFHAHVSCTDSVFFLEDMGSTNPPSVNGTVLGANQRTELKVGDRIKVGDYMLVVELDEPELARTAIANRRNNGWGDEDNAHTQIVDPDAEDLPLAGPISLRRGTTVPPSPSLLARDLGRELPRDMLLDIARDVPRTPPHALPTEAGLTEFVPRPVGTPASPDDLWRAFQEGAQVSIELPNGLRPELMRTIGGMLRSVIAGVRRLVVLRAQAKTEVDSEVTMLRSRNNNPLKFASDDTRALTALLKPPPAGFLPGPAAIEDAMNDLESHHAATQAAMRAAVEQVLLRFEPQALEQRLSNQGLLASLLPMSRKAKLWDLYVTQYRAIGTEVREGFREAFDRAFVATYDAEVARFELDRRKR